MSAEPLDEEELKQHRVDFPAWVGRRFRVRRTFPKRCYERTFQFVQDHIEVAGLVLVHGRLTALYNIAIAHSWVDLPEGLIFDGVEQACYDRARYLDVMGAESEQTYTPVEAVKLVCKTHCHGPWTEEERATVRAGG